MHCLRKSHKSKNAILIEGTRVLQSAASDYVALRTRAGAVTLADLVRSILSLRPDPEVAG
jgi:Flp pilus assembly CpaF family ATPase